MKSYTDLEQSKKLKEILSLESADMFIADVISDKDKEQIHSYNFHVLTTWGCNTFAEIKERESKHVKFIPAWSLTALLNVLPERTNISTPKSVNALGYCCWNQYDEIYANNPVDACVEMIIKLHKNLL